MRNFSACGGLDLHQKIFLKWFGEGSSIWFLKLLAELSSPGTSTCLQLHNKSGKHSMCSMQQFPAPKSKARGPNSWGPTRGSKQTSLLRPQAFWRWTPSPVLQFFQIKQTSFCTIDTRQNVWCKKKQKLGRWCIAPSSCNYYLVCLCKNFNFRKSLT